ncbi:MAG: iron-containing redox enzyme family protein [Deltaproteobacteria bacterium]|nr:iron-containing redox enzyme family protein [Deltaproteobacteria bacterium]
MTQHASSFVDRIDKIVAKCQLNLKWVAYSKDRLTVNGARVLVQQWGIFTRHSRRCWAYVVGNCSHVEIRKFIVTENLYEEEALEGHSHFDLMVRMGIAVGLSREEVESAKPLPTTTVALHAWESLTKNRTWYEGLAAKAVLEMTNKPNCGNFSALEAERWMRQLKLSRDDAEFWLLHDSVDQIHGDGSVRLLEKYLQSDPEREAAIRAAEESMMAWRVYLDGIYDAGVENNPKGGL